MVKKENKMVNYICLRYSIQNNLKGHLRIIKYILGLKLRDKKKKRIINLLNLNSVSRAFALKP